jgi:hypothetical protein
MNRAACVGSTKRKVELTIQSRNGVHYRITRRVIVSAKILVRVKESIKGKRWRAGRCFDRSWTNIADLDEGTKDLIMNDKTLECKVIQPKKKKQPNQTIKKDIS